MNQPCIPTLHNGAMTILRKPQDVIAYLIRFVLLSPGFTSDHIEDELVSFRTLEAEFGLDKQELANRLELKLKNVISHFYPNDGIAVTVESYDIEDEPNKYGLKIDVTNSSTNEPIMLATNVVVEDDTLKITFS